MKPSPGVELPRPHFLPKTSRRASARKVPSPAVTSAGGLRAVVIGESHIFQEFQAL